MIQTRARTGQFVEACPHVNVNDPRCASRFSLGRIDQAFSVCFGSYHVCPMYRRISSETAEAEAQARTAVTITVSGNDIELPLRATGS